MGALVELVDIPNLFSSRFPVVVLSVLNLYEKLLKTKHLNRGQNPAGSGSKVSCGVFAPGVGAKKNRPGSASDGVEVKNLARGLTPAGVGVRNSSRGFSPGRGRGQNCFVGVKLRRGPGQKF